MALTWPCFRGAMASKGSRFTIVEGPVLPVWPPEGSGFWVPKDSHFPAIDFFVKSRSLVVAFQVYVSNPVDAAATFFEMCKASDWFASDRQVILVYLSPAVAAKQAVRKAVGPARYPAICEADSDCASTPCEADGDCASTTSSIPKNKETRKANGQRYRVNRDKGESDTDRLRSSRHLATADAVGDHARTAPNSNKKSKSETSQQKVKSEGEYKAEQYTPHISVYTLTTADLGLEGFTW
jgi:hypothetical protein